MGQLCQPHIWMRRIVEEQILDSDHSLPQKSAEGTDMTSKQYPASLSQYPPKWAAWRQMGKAGGSGESNPTRFN